MYFGNVVMCMYFVWKQTKEDQQLGPKGLLFEEF